MTQLTAIASNTPGPAAPTRFEQLISQGFSILRFSELTLPYQLAISYYMAVDGDAWDAVSVNPRDSSPEAIATELVGRMPAFVEAYGDMTFGVLTLPTAYLQASVMCDEELHGAFSDWEAYHQWYVGMSGLPAYPPSDRWPVILSDGNDETFQDGWHRFHSYVRSGHADIPLVFYPEQSHRDRALAASIEA